MIPNTQVYKVEGSLGGEITKMSLDQSALVHIMSVLTNLYSDTELAVIREYSTNALDSHIFAGQDRPIEISTPNQLSSDFVVQDFGLGLDKEDIQNVYGNYGASTKRESNDVAGCLGLGSKSALAYTTSFVVIGVKNGIKTTAVIAMDEDGAGRIEIVDESSTDDHNGVTVRVPSSNHYDYKEKVRQFFKYWDKGTVLINGEEPEHFTDNMTELDESVWIGKDTYHNKTLTIVMGGVSYPVKDYEFTNKIPVSTVVLADMGDVDFVPSREALNMTPDTKDYLKTLVKYVKKRHASAMAQKIEAITSKRELVETVTSMPLLNGRFKWRGFTHRTTLFGSAFYYDAVNESSSKLTQVPLRSAYLPRTAILINKPFTPLSALQREKMAQYLEDKGLDYRDIYYFPEVPYLLGEADFIDFNEVNATKLPNRYTAGGRKTKDASTESWEHWVYYDRYWKGENKFTVLDPKRPITYILGGRKEVPYLAMRTMWATKDQEIQIVRVARNRENTFLKAFPNAVTEEQYVQNKVQATKDALTQADWDLRGVNIDALSWLKDKTNDPKLTQMWKASKNGAWERFTNLARQVGRYDELVGDRWSETDFVKETYPLLDSSHVSASIEYVNLVYKSRQTKKKGANK